MELPDLPYAVFGHSLTVYKDKVRLCGGVANGDPSNKCFQFDLFQTSPKWEKIAELPIKMYAHSSVQVLDDMWVFYGNNIYVIPQTGSLTVIPWPHGSLPRYSCAQTNGVNTIVIPNESRDVFINSDATSPQSWVKLATLPTGLTWRSCLMMGLLIYVTGGTTSWNGIGVKESYVIDIEKRGSVKRVGDLLTGRCWHAMGVIDGAPAVMGGWDGNKNLDSIEVFDVKSETWQEILTKLHAPAHALASVSFAVN